MTLEQVLERAAEMDPGDRWTLFEMVCRHHNVTTLPRTDTGGPDGAPYYCPICLTVFSPASMRVWNQPSSGAD